MRAKESRHSARSGSRSSPGSRIPTQRRRHETQNVPFVARRRRRRRRLIFGRVRARDRPADHHAERRFAVQRRSRLHQGDGAVRGAGQEVLRQADQLHAAQEQRARPGEAVLRVHGAGQGGRLRDRVAGAHVDLFEGRAVHRRAVHLPRPRPLEQGARRGPPEADRRRDQPEGRGDADRLRRRRHAQYLRQQAGQEHGGAEGSQGARAGRADLEPHVPGRGHGPDRDRLQRGLQRDPERCHPGRRERGRRRRADEVLRGRPEPEHDGARDHHPAALFRDQDLQQAAQGSAGRDPQGRQGGGRLRPAESSRAKTRRSSTRWRRPASSSGSRLPTARP